MMNTPNVAGSATWRRILGGAVALTALTLLGISTLATPAQSKPVEVWPAPPAGIPYAGCSFGLGIDSLGNLFTDNYDSCGETVSTPNGRISKITSTTTGSVTVNDNWGTPIGTPSVKWITVDDANNVITGGGDQVVKYLSTGMHDPNFATATGGISTLDGGLNIVDVVTDHAGNIYTANHGSGSVSKISPAGVVDWTAVTSTTQSGTVSVAVDARGNVFAANSSEDTLWKVLPDGTLAGGVWPVPVGDNPQYVTVDAHGNIYVPNSTDGTVSKVLSNGTLAGGHWPAHVGDVPVFVTIDAADNLYVTNYPDTGPAGYVSKVLPDGTLPSTGWPKTTGAGPWGAVIDSSGNLFVSNYGDGTITKFAGVAAPAPPLTLDAAPSAVAGAESATVTITPNAETAQHGTPTSYTITTVEDASKTCTITMPATSCVVEHLTADTAYTFTAKANLLTWQTAPSTASNAVTPRVAFNFPRQTWLTKNRVTMSFTAPGPGSASLTGTTGSPRASNGNVKVCSTTKAIKKAGKVTLTCTLNAKGKALRRQHTLPVVLTASFTPTGGTTSSASKNVTFKRAKTVKPKPSTTPSNVTG